MRREIKVLQRKNEELESEIEHLRESVELSVQPKRGRRGGMSVQALNARMRKLNDQVAKLEKVL